MRRENVRRRPTLKAANIRQSWHVGPQNPIPSGGRSFVAIMEPAEHRDRHHGALALRGARTLRRLERQGPVWAGGVVVRDVLLHHATQMPLTERDDVVETLPTEGADPSFRHPVGLRGPDRGQHRLDADASGAGDEVAAVGPIAVPN